MAGVGVEFLSDGQAAAFGRFSGVPTREQLERYFVLDDADRALVGRRRGDQNRLGFSVQLTTVRFLGTFLADPLQVPWVVVEFVASQLGVADPSTVKGYGARLPTKHEHGREIREAVGYRDFSEAEVELRAWLEARLWATPERPGVTFDRATAWLVERRVLLPGASVLARLVTSAREATVIRLLDGLGGRVSPEQVRSLEELLVVDEDSRSSMLEDLRQAPTRISSTGMLYALERLGGVRALGVSSVDVSELPVGRVRELARYGMAAKAQAIGRLSPARRAATLLAVAKHLETVANDDALDLFEALAAQLVGRSAREGDKDRLRHLPLLAEASASLALAVGVLFEADESLSLRQVWEAIEAQVPRAELVTATSTVADLASEVDRDDAMRAQLVDRYLTARRFLPRLIDTVTFQATPAGAEILAAVEGLGGLWARKKVSAADVALGVVPGAWRRL
ncbi:MAG: DUF4158 domain-containing protein, partial [Acidimicrobiales bacterium]